MTDAPEKIWADKEFGYNDWDAGTFCTVSDGGTEYTRTDIADARYNKLERKAVNLTETQMQWEARIAELEALLLRAEDTIGKSWVTIYPDMEEEFNVDGSWDVVKDIRAVLKG
tara:strand:+ start:3716 stop:4054 length:339 start_codon:yes stop_codon:yes gene_type:complete